ncbi:MAG: ribonuclease III [Deltaproteobacteria bacterium]|nr:ribonuclease III [Deltaproteobacteria bacterium]
MTRPEQLDRLEEALGYRFLDRTLLDRALTHSSYANEAPKSEAVRDNETLEFLGDSILGFLVAEMLFEAFPGFREGQLSKARSHLVSEPSFARLARDLGIGDALLLAPGECRSGGRVRESLLADAFEAVFAAITLDAGLGAARGVARGLFEGLVSDLDPGELSFHDYKTALQELAQGEGKPLPAYRLLSERGPDHLKEFVFEVVYDEQLSATGTGATKKEAQRQAAKAALAVKLGRAKPA